MSPYYARSTHSRYTQDIENLLKSPCTSYTLLSSIRAFNNRDPVDALNDARLLLDLQKQRCRELGLTHA